LRSASTASASICTRCCVPRQVVSARASVLETLAQFKRTTAELAFVVDDQGHFQGHRHAHRSAGSHRWRVSG
jgi:CBS domain containing-hemolysin-like protein